MWVREHTTQVKPNKTGFVKSHYGMDNICQLLNIITFVKSEGHPALVLSLDAEKAFDRVKWELCLPLLENLT